MQAELTYVTWKRIGREWNPRPVNRKSNALPLSHHAKVVGATLSEGFLMLNVFIVDSADDCRSDASCVVG